MRFKPLPNLPVLVPRIVFVIAFTALVSVAGFGQEATPLALNQAVEKELSGAATHTYRVTAQAGQFLQVIIEQRGIDLIATLFAPDGKKISEVDDSNKAHGTETVATIAEVSGEFSIEIKASDQKAKPGRYMVRLDALREPTERDRNLSAVRIIEEEANNFFNQKDPAARRKAIPMYEEAFKLWIELGDKASAAAMLTSKAGLLSQLDEPKLAIEDYLRALPLLRETGNQQSEAITLNNLGVNYNNSGEPRKAVEAFNQALPLRRALNDKRGEAITVNGLALSHRRLGEKRKAIKFAEQALSLRREVRDRAGEGVTLNTLGTLYLDIGEMQKALDFFSQSLLMRRAANENAGVATTLTNIGRAYELLGAPQEALTNYEQSLQIARAAKARRTEADTLNFMGLAYWAAGNNTRAVEHFEQALPISREVSNLSLEAAIYNNLALVYNSTGDWQRALDSLNRALPLARQMGDRQSEAKMLNNIGFAHEGLGDKDAAIKAHSQALELAREVRDAQREAKIRYGIARIESSRNRLKPAREQMEKAIKIVESQRSRLTSPDLRADYRASVQRYYDLYIDVLMRMGKRAPKSGLVAEALQVSERARARSLIELLAESAADIRQGVDAVLIERERELQDQINDKTAEQISLLRDSKKAGQAAAVAKELEQLTTELSEVQTQIRGSSPRYAALSQPQPLTLRQIQQQVLNPWSLLLEYSLGEERSYLWVVSQNSIRSFTLPKRSVIEAAAKRFYDLATARNQFVPKESSQQKQARIADADAESLRAAATLSKLILTPASSLLGNKRLIIVADGTLQYAPFQALPLNPQSARPLISRNEIVYLPSATTLAVLRSETANRAKASKSVAIIADPVFESKDERIKVVPIKADGKAAAQSENKGDKTAATVESEPSRILLYKTAKDSGGGDFSIPRLPHTRREAETILALAAKSSATADAAGKSVFDFAATRAAATGDDLSDYRVLHFATHGFLNSLNPELSGLVFSLVDEQGKPQNGYLLAPEIYNLKLPATELVVLSACQTGLGKEVRGEGIVGLTRGFMYAGAPRVAVSLWNVNDRATADLMRHFYEAMLAKGQRPAAALRAAQLELLKQKQWRAPYFWAAFGLQGEWR